MAKTRKQELDALKRGVAKFRDGLRKQSKELSGLLEEAENLTSVCDSAKESLAFAEENFNSAIESLSTVV